MTLSKNFKFILIGTALILMIPLVSMQFSNDVNWQLFDFMVAGVLLIGTGLLIDVVAHKVQSPKKRIAIVSLLVLLLMLIWAELAVGLVGSPVAGN